MALKPVSGSSANVPILTAGDGSREETIARMEQSALRLESLSNQKDGDVASLSEAGWSKYMAINSADTFSGAFLDSPVVIGRNPAASRYGRLNQVATLLQQRMGLCLWLSP